MVFHILKSLEDTAPTTANRVTLLHTEWQELSATRPSQAFSKLLQLFVNFVSYVCQSFYMYFMKSLHLEWFSSPLGGRERCLQPPFTQQQPHQPGHNDVTQWTKAGAVWRWHISGVRMWQWPPGGGFVPYLPRQHYHHRWAGAHHGGELLLRNRNLRYCTELRRMKWAVERRSSEQPQDFQNRGEY